MPEDAFVHGPAQYYSYHVEFSLAFSGLVVAPASPPVNGYFWQLLNTANGSLLNYPVFLNA